MDDMQAIIPHDSDEPKQPGVGAPVPTRPSEEPGPDPTPAPTPAPSPEPISTTPIPQSENTQTEELEPDTSWQSTANADATDRPQDPRPENVSWTAAEFVAHEKTIRWYGVLLLSGLVAAAADYFFMRDVFSTVVIVFVTVFFALFAARKPREQSYALGRDGVHIGPKTYAFHEFKNFSVVEDDATISVVFMPLKRFMPALTIYVAPEMEENVLKFLTPIMPFEQHRADMIDSLMRRIRL